MLTPLVSVNYAKFKTSILLDRVLFKLQAQCPGTRIFFNSFAIIGRLENINNRLIDALTHAPRN